jgi:hypothetical protein
MLKHNLRNAERDLAEAEAIAERGSMLIWQIEAALERTRLYLVLHQIGWEGEAPAEPAPVAADCGSRRWIEHAQEKLDEARDMIRQTEKPYEPHVPDWEEWDPPEYIGVFKKGETVGYHCRNAESEALQSAIDHAD